MFCAKLSVSSEINQWKQFQADHIPLLFFIYKQIIQLKERSIEMAKIFKVIFDFFPAIFKCSKSIQTWPFHLIFRLNFPFTFHLIPQILFAVLAIIIAFASALPEPEPAKHHGYDNHRGGGRRPHYNPHNPHYKPHYNPHNNGHKYHG